MSKTIFTGANQAVVDILRQARVDAGLTQAEVAKRLGRDQSHISLIEGSQRRIDLVEFHRLAHALDRNSVDLYAQIAAKLDLLEP